MQVPEEIKNVITEFRDASSKATIAFTILTNKLNVCLDTSDTVSLSARYMEVGKLLMQMTEILDEFTETGEAMTSSIDKLFKSQKQELNAAILEKFFEFLEGYQDDE
jgi:hypothetical protein